MNVLILTPDRVGSTLLQRLLTVYMLRRGFDKPVVNLHELSNGLTKYYNTELNQEIVGKQPGMTWGYWQSLPEIVDTLKSADHYVTSRLAHYHLVQRGDSMPDQLKFYEYLNENFYIIACRRSNVFEHALSWVIQSHSKKLNVFNAAEKIDIFSDIYNNGIIASKAALVNYLNQYKKYIEWSDRYFKVQSYFDYETDMKQIEKYILNLEFMQGHTSLTWQDMFGQDFDVWNTCHRMLPNLMLHNPESPNHTHRIGYDKYQIDQLQWDNVKSIDWPNSPTNIDATTLAPEVIKEIEQRTEMKFLAVTQEQHQFLSTNIETYKKTCKEIDRLQELGLMITGIPIKLQSLKEKQFLIKNFDQCIEWYNDWASKNEYETVYTKQQLDQLAEQEEQILNQSVTQQLAHTANKMLGSM